MRFQGLPEHMTVGATPLQPCSHSPLLQPCVSCRYVKTRFVTCTDQKHAICEECSLTQSDGRRWCPACAEFVVTTPRSVSIDLLGSLLFKCRSGYRGTLAEIRQYLIQDGLRGRGARLDLQVAEDRMDDSSELATEGESSNGTDNVRAVALRHVSNLCFQPRASLHQRSGTCHVWFDFEVLHQSYLENGGRSKNAKAFVVIGDLPIEVYLVLDNTSGVDHLTVVALVSPTIKDEAVLALRDDLRLMLIDKLRTPLPQENYLKTPSPVNSDICALLSAQSAVVSLDVLKEKVLTKRAQICVAIELRPPLSRKPVEETDF